MIPRFNHPIWDSLIAGIIMEINEVGFYEVKAPTLFTEGTVIRYTLVNGELVSEVRPMTMDEMREEYDGATTDSRLVQRPLVRDDEDDREEGLL